MPPPTRPVASEDHFADATAWFEPEQPVAQADAPSSDVELAGDPGEHPSQETAQATILIVEDNPDMRAYLRNQLETHD